MRGGGVCYPLRSRISHQRGQIGEGLLERTSCLVSRESFGMLILSQFAKLGVDEVARGIVKCKSFSPQQQPLLLDGGQPKWPAIASVASDATQSPPVSACISMMDTFMRSHAYDTVMICSYSPPPQFKFTPSYHIYTSWFFLARINAFPFLFSGVLQMKEAVDCFLFF